MNMNCPFCNTNLNIDAFRKGWTNGRFRCYVCSVAPVDTDIFMSDVGSEIEIIHIKVNNYLIELVQDQGFCNVFNFNVKACKLITLDYIPDVTPATAVAWLNKLINLRAFF